ncbi:MAG: amino acid decarboxylase, partial [Clostridia bacterium]|nr:amino acid decarboxylase [Clostridia bacterium]
AHKTLPCLTGSAYLHVSRTALHPYEKDAKRALSLFASTSPSYLLLASMDKANEVMSGEFEKRIIEVSALCDELKTRLSHLGIEFSGREKLKINIKPKSCGYNGKELSHLLEKDGIIPEFCDSDNLVLMFSADNTKEDFERLISFFERLDRRSSTCENPPSPPRLKVAMSVRDAVFSRQEKVPVKDSVGRILSSPCVSCPPAIPIAVCGEIVDENAVKCFEYYGITHINVVCEKKY